MGTKLATVEGADLIYLDNQATTLTDPRVLDPMPANPPFDIAVFGAGRIGNVNGRNIAEHPDSRVKYVIDPFAEGAQKLATLTGAAVATEEQALGDPAIAAIVVGTATSTHAELIEKRLLAGMAVFCEKPIDLDMTRVDEVMAATASTQSPLFLAFNRRFDPGLLELKARILAGDVGELELVTVISEDPGGGLPLSYPKTSGGMFRDMTIHDFDMARHIMGEDFVSISAEASVLTDPAIAGIGDIDTAVVTLRTASGKLAVITNSRRAAYEYDQRVEAHGVLGTIGTENVPTNMSVLERADGVHRAKPLSSSWNVMRNPTRTSGRISSMSSRAKKLPRQPANMAARR